MIETIDDQVGLGKPGRRPHWMGLLRPLCLAGGFLWIPAILCAAPLTLYSAGEMATAYSIPEDLRSRLEKGIPQPDSSLDKAFYAIRAAATPETLALPQPLFSLPLPGTATSLLLPSETGGGLIIATRSGLVEVDRGPKPKLKTLLPDLDIGMAQVDAAGTVYLLLRTWKSDLGGQQKAPAPVLAWKPGSTDPPDTIATAAPGSCALFLAPGDSLIWIPRLNGRTVDRLLRKGDRWERTEVSLSALGNPHTPSLWKEWILFVPPREGPAEDPILFDQARGARPRLLRLDPQGEVGLLYTWNRGIQGINASFAWQAGMCMVNGGVQISVMKVSTGEEVYLPCTDRVSSVALSQDGEWLAEALSPAQMERTRIELGRSFCTRIATSWVDGLVTVLRISEAGDGK